MSDIAPMSITFRHLSPSDELAALVKRGVSQLQGHGLRIVNVRATIELAHHEHRKNLRYFVQVEVVVPGRSFVAKAHRQDPRTAVNVAFRTAGQVLASN